MSPFWAPRGIAEPVAQPAAPLALEDNMPRVSRRSLRPAPFVFRFALILLLSFNLGLWGQPIAVQAKAPEKAPLVPLMSSPPSISLSVPAEAFIGDNVTFTVTFDNTDTVPGYGPLMDLIIPTNGPDGAPNPDGLTFVNATYLGVALEKTVITVPGSGCVTHPYMRDNTGAYVQVCSLTPGDTFVALRLPFGSFTPEQPPLVVNVTTSMSNLADLGTPLTIRARGGYEFGYTPLDDWCCGDDPSLSLSGWTSGSVTPILFTLSKSYNGPEDETATGPNFPRRYTVTAQIAAGQSMTSFNLTDVLPNNMQFVSLVSTNPGGASCTLPSTSTPGGTLSCNFSGSVSGTVTMTFEYYIPLRDSGNASVINPASGDDVTSCNNASGGGTWTPLDGRDTGGAFSRDPAGCEHTLNDRSIAIQKGVSVVGGGDVFPGQRLEYTLNFQISDFFAFQNVVVTDIISDGQHFDPSFVPTLQINGNSYALGSAGFTAANYDVTCNYTGGPGPECTANDPAANDGATTLTFRISDEIITRGQNGKLIGGCVPTTGTGGGDPNCGTYDDGPTTGTITFRTIIQQDFTDTYPSGDPSVDQGDTLNDNVVIDGVILSTSDVSTPTGFAEDDDSASASVIGRGLLTKAIYAVNGNTSFSTPVEVKPGDTVTYRLTYTLPTGDIEDMEFDDYLPLPVFHVGDPDENGIPGPAWVFDNVISGTAPAAGHAHFGPADTFRAYSGIVPGITANIANNRLNFFYGDFDGTNEQQYIVDILFTVTVSDEPFADRLYLTNQAHAYEGSTNAGTADANAIVQIILTEPVLVTSKGVIWTNNSNATFNPATTGPVTFLAPASAPRWSGTINSTNLAASPIDSDITGIDAGDTVSFAIVIENQGSSLNGAFDIDILDTLPAGFQIPSGGLNLQIYYGNGTGPIAYTRPDGSPAAPGDLFTTGIRLVDPVGQGVCSAHNPNLGNNIIVLIYDLEASSTITPGTITNVATITHYAGSEGGPNHVPTPSPIYDDASATVLAAFDKDLVETEINDAYNNNTQVVIGEIVTYRLTSTVPEGLVPNAFVLDQLDSGLAFVSCVSVTASSPDVTTDLAGGFAGVCATTEASGVTNNGHNIRFDLGNVTNANRDNATAETITIIYRAVALNILGNQTGSLLNNSAAFYMNDGSGNIQLDSDSAPNVTVIEPTVNTSKGVVPSNTDAGNTVTFTVTLTNPASGSTTAHDVTWSDIVPSGLTYVPGTLALGACTASTPLTLSDAGAPTLTGSGGLFQPGQSCVITFDAVVDYSVSPGQQITNTAQTRWTSLAGDVNDRSPYNTASDERTGADGLLGSGVLNDYRTQGTATVTINNVAPQKYLLATSEAHTGFVASNERVAIGEIIRYRLVVSLPEGTSTNFQIRDYLPNGLMYLDDGTAQAAFVSNGAGITSSNVGTLPVPGITDPDCFLTGNSADGTTPAIPAACAALADNNVGSTNSIATDTDNYTTGADPYFKLGTLTNNDSDADAEYVIVEFNALMDNTATGSNDAGETRGNYFVVTINGVQNGSNSNTVTVYIAEPSLSLVKAVTPPAPSDAGDTVTYTLTITAASSGDNRATAFDLNVTDTFDSYLTGITVTNVTTTQGPFCAGNTLYSASSLVAGQTLTFTATCLDPGRSITITVSGTVVANVPAGYTIPNTAILTYTSLPGTGTSPNPTGSTTPGASGADNGERNGSLSPAHNDLRSSSTVNSPLSTPSIVKQAPAPTGYPIGATVTFPIRITLPEGVTRAVRVLDAVPNGMQYVSYSVDTTGYNGTVGVPTITGGASNGDDVTFDFGDITTTDDNNASNNAFTLNVTLRVLDVAGNEIGTVLTNGASLTYKPGTGSTDTTLSGGTQNITVLEPRIATTKSVLPTSGVQAGDSLTYTVRFTNTGTATAYEVTADDVLAQGVVYNNDAACIFFNGTTSAPISVTVTGAATLHFDGSPAGSWDIPATDPDSYIECTYTVTAQPSLHLDGGHTNTVDADWTSLNGTDANERVYDDTVSRTVDGTQDTATAAFTSPAPAFDKSDNATTLSIGATYHVTLTLTSPLGTLRSLTVSDVLPAGLIYVTGSQTVSSGIAPAPTFTVSAPNDGSAPVTLTWDFGDAVISSSPITITYNVQVANVVGNQNGDTRTNSATLTYTDAGGADESLNDTDSITILEPELDIQKSADDTTPAYGQTITYTLTVSHLASSTATAYDIVISDTIPSGLTYVAGSISAPAGWTTNDAGAPTLTWTCSNPCSLPVGNTASLAYQVTVNGPPGLPNPGDVLTNTASMTWTSLDGTDSNERTGAGGFNDYADSDGESVIFTAIDLTLSKDDGGITSSAGGVVSYTLSYSNVGNSPASGVTITEAVPANTTFNAGVSTPGWSCADGSPAGTTCEFNVGTLNAGGSGSVTFAVTVNNPLPAGVTQISNSASIADDGTHGLEADSSNNSDSDTTPVTAAPDLVITKDDGFTVVAPGQTITYTLTISNTGTQDATGVVVTDTLPADTTFVSTSDGGTYDNITGVVTWPAFDLAAGAPAVTRTVTIQVNDPFPGASILNQAHVEDDGSNGSDLTPADNDATDTDSVVTLPNSDLTKSLVATDQTFTPGTSVAIGEILTYQVVFTVPAGGTMTNLTLTDILDRGLAFVDCVSVAASDPSITTTLPGGFADACNDPANPTVAAEPPGSATPADAGRTITFDLGDVSNSGASNGTVSIRYTVVVLDSIENQDGVNLNNSATLTWDSGTLSAAATNVTIVEPDFELLKEADRTVAPPGSVITFTLTFRHTAQSNTDAFDVVLTDVLPSWLTYVPGSLTIVSGPPGGVPDDSAAPTLRVTWANFPLLTGGSRTEAVVRFQATLGSLSPGQGVQNTASLEWTSLPGDVTLPQSSYNTLSTERYYDPGSDVNIYGTQAQVVITTPALPATGFAPGRTTVLPSPPFEWPYATLGNLRLEIPKLGVNIPIVGVPLQSPTGWDLTWLSNQAGWLEGTAFPTWKGNSALTAHVYLANGLPGPFFNLHLLAWGDRIIIHFGKQRYLYEVRQVRRVWPNDLSVLRHEEYPWLTLITCRTYDEKTETYRYRIVVRAVQVRVESDE